MQIADDTNSTRVPTGVNVLRLIDRVYAIRPMAGLALALFLLISGSCKGLEQTGETGREQLQGVVQDSAGTAIAGMVVEWNGQEAETDEQGKFELHRDGSREPFIYLSVEGPYGTGSYRFRPEEIEGPLELEYPVVTKVVILHDNDLHFNFSHREQFETIIKTIRERYKNVWLMNGGDTFVRHAHRWAEDDTSYYRNRSRFMIETMNEVGYEVSVAGNHEIDYVGEHSGESLRLADFPMLGANIDIETDLLPGLDPYAVFETTNGLSMAVLGHSTVNFDKPGVSSRDPVETTKEYLHLRDEHDLFIALTHIGFGQDMRLANEVPELDVIVGGHSHTLLEEARMVNGVLVAQAGGPPPEHQVNDEWPKYLGKVTLVLENDRIVEKTGRVIPLGPEGEYFIQTAPIPEEYDHSDKVAFSGRVLPHTRQLKWFEDEFFGFIHFGPNTFTGQEWGEGTESPELFNPVDLDVDQWVRTMKAAGMRRVVVVAKHHEGFALWSTRYTDHSVASSPWMDGDGDLIRKLAESVREHGLRLGIYLSPADLYQIESDGGYYGNDSEFTERAIPRRVVERPFEDDRTFSYRVDDYNEFFLNQLFELLTEYGPVHEIWFDGANPRPGTGQTYNYEVWYDLIRNLAPDASIFGKGPDARWVGNEGGRTREAEYNVIPLEVHPDDFDWPDMMQEDVASRDRITEETRYFHYYPAETNTSIRHGWFWRNDNEQQVRSADDVFDIYERSVGGNSVFHLNIPPNDRGLFSDRDVEVLQEVGRRIEEVYGSDELMDGVIIRPSDLSTDSQPGLRQEEASQVESWETAGSDHRADTSMGETGTVVEKDITKAMRDGSPHTWWQAPGREAALVMEFPEPREINRFVVSETIAHRGERVESHKLEAKIDDIWQEVAAGKTIGHKRILRFPAIQTDALRLTITDARMPAGLSHLSAHLYDEPPKPVVIRRGAGGEVTLGVGTSFSWNDHGTADQSQPIYYTLDGSEPGSDSHRYEEPVELPDGGFLRARAIVGGREGPLSERHLGMVGENWRATDPDGADDRAINAFDGDSGTYWNCCETDTPYTLELDLRELREIAGFTYIPARNNGYIEFFAVEVSRDGDEWQLIYEGSFGNIRNDPSRRTVTFDTVHEVRYIRFSDLVPPGGIKQTGASEIEILPATPVNDQYNESP